jgi:hypothetical protein
MDGYRGRDYFTKEEFKEACSFNFWFGAGSGVFGTIAIASITIVLYGWSHNWF